MNSTERSQLKQEYLAELLKLSQAQELMIVSLSPTTIISIIGSIQLASRHPEAAGNHAIEISIDAARQLQSATFPPDTVIYKVLELGWSSKNDIPREEKPLSARPEPMDRYEHPEETRSNDSEVHWHSREPLKDRFDEDFYPGKTFSQRCRDEGINPCDDLPY